MKHHAQKSTLKFRLVALCWGLLAFFALSQGAYAVVYTASNEAEGNRIIAFDLDEDGNLVEIGSFPTGGAGTGASLGNQSAITTDASDRWMFVTNSGDGTLTSFRLQEEGLQFVNRINSRGHAPISVTVFGTLVYVLNEGSGLETDAPRLRYDNIAGFRFNPQGQLEFIRGSVRILDRHQLTAPAQVGFNKSGTVLLVTEKATNTITTYLMRDDDRPVRRPLKRPSAVPTPFGFEFGDRDYVFITEANAGGAGVTAAYRVNRGNGEVSGLVDSIAQGDATCWTVLSNDQTVGYSVNTGSGTLSPYRINFNGTLEPFDANRPNRQIATGAGPRDAVLTQNNRSLITLNNGDGEIRAFRVFSNGALGPRNRLPVPASVTGLMAR